MSKYTSETKSCVACGTVGVDLHHIKSRKSGGTDDKTNLLPLCRTHHTEVHFSGLNKLSFKYRLVASWLRNNGWDLCEYRGKWIRYEEKT